MGEEERQPETAKFSSGRTKRAKRLAVRREKIKIKKLRLGGVKLKRETGPLAKPNGAKAKWVCRGRGAAA